MNREQAAAILGCQPRSPAEVVRAAFAAKLKAIHPDGKATAQAVKDVAEPIRKLKHARDLLLVDAPTDCPQCRGSGWVAVQGFKKVRCPRGC